MPLICHIFLSYLIFNYIRLKIGYSRLNHKELHNKRFINDMPIVSMFTGSMGTNKTTMLTDIAISKSEQFKNKALSFILDVKKKYPDFNFNLFDNLVINYIDDNKIYNIVSIDDSYIKLIEDNKEDLNYDKYLFDNSLIISSIDNDLKDYIKLMLIYITTSNLIMSNYAIRTDDSYVSCGNFPLYQFEYFKTKSYQKKDDDVFSHILDFDLMRLGKRLNNNMHNFDFGIFVITEIGKERGNQLTQQGLKKTDELVNQKNDNFNNFVKLIRHYSTICHYPFCFFICDDQRPESVNADLKELMYLYKIDKKKNNKILIPFLGLKKLMYELLLDRYNLKIKDRIYRRSDTTLLYYLNNKFIHFIYKRYLFYINTFSCFELVLIERDAAALDSNCIKKYYLMPKKIYSNRFSTDAYSNYFNYEKIQSKKGINSYERYKDVKATESDLNKQNSFLISELEEIKNIKNKE